MTSDVVTVSQFINVKMKIMFINIKLIKLSEKHPVFLPLWEKTKNILQLENGFDKMLNLAMAGKLYCQKSV